MNIHTLVWWFSTNKEIFSGIFNHSRINIRICRTRSNCQFLSFVSWPSNKNKRMQSFFNLGFMRWLGVPQMQSERRKKLLAVLMPYEVWGYTDWFLIGWGAPWRVVSGHGLRVKAKLVKAKTGPPWAMTCRFAPWAGNGNSQSQKIKTFWSSGILFFQVFKFLFDFPGALQVVF